MKYDPYTLTRRRVSDVVRYTHRHMHTHMLIHKCARTRTPTHAIMDTHIQSHLHTGMYTQKSTFSHVGSTPPPPPPRTHTHTDVHLYTHTYSHTSSSPPHTQFHCSQLSILKPPGGTLTTLTTTSVSSQTLAVEQQCHKKEVCVYQNLELHRGQFNPISPQTRRRFQSPPSPHSRP